jgi:hypothetical protein
LDGGRSDFSKRASELPLKESEKPDMPFPFLAARNCSIIGLGMALAPIDPILAGVFAMLSHKPHEIAREQRSFLLRDQDDLDVVRRYQSSQRIGCHAQISTGLAPWNELPRGDGEVGSPIQIQIDCGHVRSFANLRAPQLKADARMGSPV